MTGLIAGPASALPAGYRYTEEGQPKEPHVVVESEDQPSRRLLETKIVKDDGFQKQQGMRNPPIPPPTKKTNCPPPSLDMGCAAIWKFIDQVQQTFQGTMSGPDDSLSDDLTMELPPSIQLPPADLASLPELDMAIRNLSQSPAGRDALAKTIMAEDYISKLIPLVEMAEDLESLPDLHRLCNIMKTVLLLNDTSIIEHAVSDDCVLGVVGALEYDPDFPSHKANHRQWLNNQGRYKEVVRIQDEQVRRKIHMTYRLQYLKDVVLARILDDPTFSVLNSLIFFNQVDIVQHLHTTPGFMQDLFAIFHDPHEQPLRKKEAVLFIQQCCAIAKNLQPPARQGLYVHFLKEGLLPAINYGMRHRDVSVRVGATDVLVSMIDHDPSLVRQTIYEQIQKRLQPLTDTLIDLLLVEVDLGVKSQISEALKVLLDPCPAPVQQQQQQQQQQEARGEIAGQARLRAHPGIDPQQDVFLTHFYEHSAARLFKPLIDLEKRVDMKFTPSEEGVFSYLNDILCFYIQRHHHRSKFFVFTYNIASRFVQLLACKEKHLQLVAVRFFRHLVILQDDFYIKHMVDKQVLGPILDVLLRTLPRDNLLSSACLELFMLVNKENLKELIKHAVENYREKITALSYMTTFSEILHRYDHTQGFTLNIDPYFESEDELGRARPPNGAARGMMEHLTVDQAQEDYWNTSDDEDDLPVSQVPNEEELRQSLGIMGDRSPSKPLVEYNSDEEADENDVAMTTTALPSAEGSTTTTSASGDGASSSSPSTTQNVPQTARTNGIASASSTTSPSPSATGTTTTTAAGSAAASAAAVAAAAAAAAASPPERLSEKRRREEDDDDDALDKLTQNKRRNSSSTASNASVSVSSSPSPSSSTATAILRKKRSFSGQHGHSAGAGSTSNGGGGGSGATGMKKIAISLSPAAKAAVVKADEGAGDGSGDGSGGDGDVGGGGA
ncbi:component of IIS longevity pathway SMK-1-domain-containing protein [Corynascus novoguineensis]|uniref:Component of IIS longevity pathway SMK-1-domain-containing protein n=1 Tax=Corynascus novoguineensis TaxID=1126955 RepID=A0AAN7HIM7_9PEZI|nr:component of IIS longevity pathway SMK-1-domain-containing protein [Corynascus novoguineensis]